MSGAVLAVFVLLTLTFVVLALGDFVPPQMVGGQSGFPFGPHGAPA